MRLVQSERKDGIASLGVNFTAVSGSAGATENCYQQPSSVVRYREW